MQSNNLLDLNDDHDHLDYVIAKLKPTGKDLTLSDDYKKFGDELPLNKTDKSLIGIVDGKKV